MIRHLWRHRVAYLFIAPALVHFLAFQLYPILWSVSLSFVRFNMQGNRWVGAQNYALLVGDPIFWRSLANAALYAAAVVPAGLALALGLSALIFPLPARAQTFYKSAFYLPGVVSVVVLSMVWLWLFDPTNKGLLNYVLSIAGVGPVPWLGSDRLALYSLAGMAVLGGLGGSVVVYLAAMGGIPPELYEAAVLDGAGGWAQFRRITLPLLRPATLYLTVMGTIGSFQVFGSIYLMTRGGPNYATTTVVYRIYQVAFEFLKLGRACAAAMILAAIIVTISALQFRFIGREIEY